MMSLGYLEDVPSEKPQFDYALVAKALMPLLRRQGESATVVGVHGPWGSGKTTLMRAVQRELQPSIESGAAVCIDFNAWKFQDREALWRALILHTVGELKKCGTDEETFEELQASLYRAFAVDEKGPWTVNWKTLIVELIGVLLSLVKLDFVGKAIKDSTGWFGRLFAWGTEKDEKKAALVNEARVKELSGILERETVTRHVDQVQSIEQFLDKFRKLVGALSQGGRRVYVFVDDLDRCLPETALEVFEAIKLFLDAPGCVYVVALDREVIRKGLAVKYARHGEALYGQSLVDPDEYIEKTISLSFDLPRLSQQDVFSLIAEAKLPIKLEQRHQELIVRGLGTNPRRIKRFLNTLAVQLYLAQLTKESGAPVHPCLLEGGHSRELEYFVKLLLIAYNYSGLFALALQDPDLFGRLQQTSNRYRQAIANKKALAEVRSDRNKDLSAEVAVVKLLQDEERFWLLMAEQPDFLNDGGLLIELQDWFRRRPAQAAANSVPTT